ncbi:MAG: hypothetical protein IPF53_04065 [Blastocatellia bacterium]|nr:hypothetical protein [Blastocatellia bacterium]MBK6428302.1 hypothetical protein [Blastocatellia bacterium]
MSNTLILALAPLAESAMLLEPLAARRSTNPGERITLAGCPALCEIAKSLGLVADAWEVAPASDSSRSATSVIGAVSLLAKARRGAFDLVIDLFPRVASGLASIVAAGPSAPNGNPLEGMFRSRSRAMGLVDPVSRMTQQLGVVGIDVAIPEAVDPDADVWIERALRAIGYGGGGSVVVLHTSGAWPTERFAEVGERIRSAFGAWLVALDAPKGDRRAKLLAARLGGSVLGVGAPTGARFLAAISRASLVVTDDQGVAHIAGLTHVPVVLVGGAETSLPGDRPDRSIVSAASADRVDSSAVLDAASYLLGRPRTGSLFSR